MKKILLGVGELPPPPSADELTSLLSQLPDTREIIIERSLRLVAYVVGKFETGIEAEELFSIGSIGLIKAVDTFNAAKEIKFATYASRCIENEILMFLRRNSKHLKNTHLDDILRRDHEGNELTLREFLLDPNSELEFSVYENREKISDVVTMVLNEFTILQQLVFFYTLGELTQSEIGEILLLSQSYISRVQKAVQNKLYTNNGKKASAKKGDFLVEENFYRIRFPRQRNVSDFMAHTTIPVVNSAKYICCELPKEPESFRFIAEALRTCQG